MQTQTKERVASLKQIEEVMFSELCKYYGRKDIEGLGVLFKNISEILHVKTGLLFEGKQDSDRSLCLKKFEHYRLAECFPSRLRRNYEPVALLVTDVLPKDSEIFVFAPECMDRALTIVDVLPRVKSWDLEERVVFRRMNEALKVKVMGRHHPSCSGNLIVPLDVNVPGYVDVPTYVEHQSDPDKEDRRVNVIKRFCPPINPDSNFCEDIKDLLLGPVAYREFLEYQRRRGGQFTAIADNLIESAVKKSYHI